MREFISTDRPDQPVRDSDRTRRLVLGGLAATLATPAFAQTQVPPSGQAQAPGQPVRPPASPYTPRPEAPTGTRLPPGGQPTPPESETLDTGYDPAARMTAKVMLNGKGPFDFVVDTGANRTVVATEVAALIQLPAGAPTRVHGIAEPYMAATADIEQLQVGGLRMAVKGAPLLSHADLGCDGLLGIDVLRSQAVTMDFVSDKLEIGRSGGWRQLWSVAGPSDNGVTVQARQRFGQLTIVDAQAGHAKMTCFIDSGAQRTVGNIALRNAVQAAKPDAFQPIDVLIRGATGQVVKGEVALVPSMRIGGVNFTSFGMAFADLHTFELWGLQNEPALLIGMDILRIFELVTIDFGSREVRFRPAASGRRSERQAKNK